VATHLFQSRWVTGLKKLAVSFFWGFVFALFGGALAFYRLERVDLQPDVSWFQWPRVWIERLELITYDWRVRELGGAQVSTDEVVLVNIDDETISNGRESSHGSWGMKPWPRELWATVTGQLLAEGASLVVLDGDFSDASPHSCVETSGVEPGDSGSNVVKAKSESVLSTRETDDVKLGDCLSSCGPRCILGIDATQVPHRPPEKPLRPFLVLIKRRATRDEAALLSPRILQRNASVYAIAEAAATTFDLWAGLASEDEAKRFGKQFGEPGAHVRALTTADDDAEITSSSLALANLKKSITSVRPAASGSSSEAKAFGSPVQFFETPVASLLSPQSVLGVRTLVPDFDGVVRSMPLAFALKDGTLAPSVSALVSQLNGGRLVWTSRGAHFENSTFEVDAQGSWRLEFQDEVASRERGTTKRALSAWRVLMNATEAAQGGTLRRFENDLKGRVVVLTDLREASWYQTPVGRMNSASLLAQGIQNILKKQSVVRVSPRTDFWITVSFAFLGSLLALAWSSMFRRPGWLAWVLTVVGLVVLHGFFARQLFVAQARWIVMALPILAATFSFLASLGYARTLEQRLREFVMRALGGAVRSDVVSRVERDLALMRPERRMLTVYCGDIEGFTSVSTVQPPEVMVKVLRQHLDLMTNVVVTCDGHVDKYLGDGVMAFWGAPVARRDDALRACEAALGMLRAFQTKQPEFETLCKQRLALRCGLEMGQAIVGEMGTAQRLNYTVMGEVVSSSFHLESLAKKYAVHILCGPQIYEFAQARFQFRMVDLVFSESSQRPYTLYELVAKERHEWIDRWNETLERYRVGEFAEAYAGLIQLAIERPDDALLKRYLRRCEMMQIAPPANFDGIFPFEEHA
jgi:adenylate cyclase